ncbi:efflux RND transporter permease subunit [Pareuzebyella sediminis]|uniref:efflux RND transporter permease subunit n=1 Tax=Pareuzebyella sediminis TaxID=2607998 RepID=UPI0011F03E4E|nr:efflux RND transporter permease subunit [Pareuzebyella sediminis]
MLNRSIKYLIENKLIALVVLVFFFAWGIILVPFDLNLNYLPNNPVTVDAIPDLGENQQIVFVEWPGQSPQDVEDQITYPLTSNLLGVPGVKSIRSSSMFGLSNIYVIFEDDIEFYWARSRLMEKLNTLPKNFLPIGATTKLGPDATALGQIFWYTIEGRDEEGKVTGGWDLHEIRAIQDFYVKNSLSSVSGVSEVSSIGGYVKEYQIDVNPEIMRRYDVSLSEVVRAVRESNQSVGAKTLEINNAEYFVRGLGYIEHIEDIENTSVKVADYTPIKIKDIAKVSLGPAERRGILDKEGAEVVGGVVVSRFGANPMNTIKNLKERVREISTGLPSKVLKDGRRSQLTIVPFYDRSQLIEETLETLSSALSFEVLITILVIVIMLFDLRASFLISGLMPVAVLIVFIAMKTLHVDANIVALSGIAIAIGTMVDIGIILTENIVAHLDRRLESEKIDEVVYRATTEVSGAILTAGFTTIVSFIPVFILSGPEGKLFTPLAFTKTFALLASMAVALFIIPPFAALIFRPFWSKLKIRGFVDLIVGILGLVFVILGQWLGLLLVCYGSIGAFRSGKKMSKERQRQFRLGWIALSIVVLLGYYWRPLGYGVPIFYSLVLVGVLCTLVLGAILFFKRSYENILYWALKNKLVFLSIPLILIIIGILIMAGSGREFMPSLNEGSFLLMPTSMPHSGISENKRVLTQIDMAVAQLPEVETVVGKAGRVNSALDPAPLSMFESHIRYKPEYILDGNGKPVEFKTNRDGLFETKEGTFVTSGSGYNREDLVKDEDGSFYRNWRSEIKNENDIWEAISRATQFPGVTGAPKLQPIETRLIMLQTGMRSPMGIKIKGIDLKSIEAFGVKLESVLKKLEGISAETVFAERIIAKPYLLIDIRRDRISRYGISVAELLETLEVATGGKILSETVEGRERYGIKVQYPRELREAPEDFEKIFIRSKEGATIPLMELISIKYEPGAQVIKSEDGFLVGYVLFDKEHGFAEVDVVENAEKMLQHHMDSGELAIPQGVSYSFTGTFENHQHAKKTLSFVVPLVLLIIVLILFFQFRSVIVSLMIFSAVAVAFAGGFILLWLYGQSWFLDFNLGDINLRELFNIETVNLSVAVWVGFIALFGIATDDGVIMATYLKQRFNQNRPQDIKGIHAAVLEAGRRRIRPCLMTTATTILALLPILMSKGRGSDIMIPIAIPCFGGMFVALTSLFVVPVLFSWNKELALRSATDK